MVGNPVTEYKERKFQFIVFIDNQVGMGLVIPGLIVFRIDVFLPGPFNRVIAKSRSVPELGKQVKNPAAVLVLDPLHVMDIILCQEVRDIYEFFILLYRHAGIAIIACLETDFRRYAVIDGYDFIIFGRMLFVKMNIIEDNEFGKSQIAHHKGHSAGCDCKFLEQFQLHSRLPFCYFMASRMTELTAALVASS